MSEPVLLVDDLVVSRGRAPVLDELSFRVEKGENVVLLGPNGAGKTTLLQTVIGLTDPQSGRVRIKGTPREQLTKQRLATLCAYVPQENPENVPFPVRQFLSMSRYPYRTFPSGGDKGGRDVVDRVLADTGLEPLSDRPVNQLSGGERRKVMIAAALVQEPELLLLDEATTFLDPHHRQAVLDILKREHEQRDTTLFFVTHDINRAVLQGERILVLKDGSLGYDGAPDDLLDEGVLEDVYDTDLEVIRHPDTGQPMVAPTTLAPPEEDSS